VTADKDDNRLLLLYNPLQPVETQPLLSRFRFGDTSSKPPCHGPRQVFPRSLVLALWAVKSYKWRCPLTEKAPTSAVYLTPDGARQMRAELKEILYTLRPEMVKTAAWAASNGDRSENADYHYAKRRLRQLDSRIRFLSKRLEAATIVDPVEQLKIAKGRVLFGARVRVENEAGEEKTFRIVGADELDLSRGHISWTSPLGRALLGAKSGELVSFDAPGGKTELEILEVDYRPF